MVSVQCSSPPPSLELWINHLPCPLFTQVPGCSCDSGHFQRDGSVSTRGASTFTMPGIWLLKPPSGFQEDECLLQRNPSLNQDHQYQEFHFYLGWNSGLSHSRWILYLLSHQRSPSVQFSSSVVSDSLQPHESQHARPPSPSPTPGVHSDSCPSSQWCHPAISSSVIPFSFCPQSLPASQSFPMSQLFTWGGQRTGVSASASFLPKNTQGWSPSEWTGWISMQSKGLLRVFSNTTVQKHQFFSAQPSSQSNSHIHTWPQEKPYSWLDEQFPNPGRTVPHIFPASHSVIAADTNLHY